MAASKKTVKKKINQDPLNLFPQAPTMPKDLKEKMDKLKKQLDSFSKKVLAKYNKAVLGIALLPPPKPKTPGEKVDASKMDILVLIDDAAYKKIPRQELVKQLTNNLDKIAKDIDKKFNPEVLLTSELTESCYDAKYEVLSTIAAAAPLYDPNDMLAAIKISEVHKTMTLKKFDKYILSYVAAGSLFRGEKSNDIDVYIVIDDTDVKRMSRAELKDKLRAIILGMGAEASKITGVKKQFHIQTYILTDFWDSIKDANPVIYTFLRDGVPLYDRGVFMPWKLLLRMGRVKPSPEAIDMNMDLGKRLITRTKHKLLSVVGEDLYYAVLNPAQAALMLYGIPPPTPKETGKLMEEIFVKKEKILEKKYVDILEKLRLAFKAIEHGKTKEVTGKEIDDMLKDAKDYLDRIEKLFKEIEKKAQQKSIVEIYDTCFAVTKDLLAVVGVENVSNAKLIEMFKKKLIEEEKIPERFLKILEEVIKAKKDFDKGKLNKYEINKVNREARQFIKVLVEHMQRRKVIELERAKIRFKAGSKFGEMILLDDVAFLVPNLEKRDEIFKADVNKNGKLGNFKKTDLAELEKFISKLNMPRKVFIKESIFEDLKNQVGKDIEILVGY